jgi:hypothetical protein
MESLWVQGAPRSGKTARLVEQFRQWGATDLAENAHPLAAVLVFAANGDNRLELVDRLTEATRGQFRFESNTPLGFFQREVLLFWSLLVQKLDLRAQFPLRLRPETEQELATRLWQPELEAGQLAMPGVPEYFIVRRSLDLLQLAASAGVPAEDIPTILQDGLAGQVDGPELWACIGKVLQRWRQWCLERGLLTYGLVSELYWRYLLPDEAYRRHLQERYRAVLADDVDDYPAIAGDLFHLLLDQGMPGTFTFNPDGALRWGLGADPAYLATLAERCQREESQPPAHHSLGAMWGHELVRWVQEPLLLASLPEPIQAIQTVSRADLLKASADFIATSIQSGAVRPEDVAVIGPGLDAIARYTLRQYLGERGIPVQSLNDQHPLASSPLIRALLTLMGLVYPGLGRLLDREAIAEMLVILSQSPQSATDTYGVDQARIDPVRAGLITDHCFVADPDQPQLLPVDSFPRWDRLGYQATTAYQEITRWIVTQRQQQQQRLIPSPASLLDRAIQQFLYGGSHLPADQLAVVRELMETAQHYWEVDSRLRQIDPPEEGGSDAVSRFIQLLRGGTITADPYPVRPIGPHRAVTLATIFQYRAQRCTHPWQFWLDASSPLWLSGGGALFGAPLMLRDWGGRPWTAVDALAADQQRLRRQLLDLLYRATERVYLCHSELSTNGQEQAGPLLTLVNVANAVASLEALG